MPDRVPKDTREERCPNPYCDGRGWIRCDATGTNNAYWTPGCRVGPHPDADSEAPR